MVQERFTTPEPVRLRIRVPSGDVEVATTEAGESTVTVDGSEKLLAATTVELAGGRLLIESRRKSLLDWGHRSLRVWVHVPRRSSVEIVAESVDATLDGTFAALETRSASGSLRVTGEVVGDATVKSVSGDARLPRVGGNLEVRRCPETCSPTGRRLRLCEVRLGRRPRRAGPRGTATVDQRLRRCRARRRSGHERRRRRDLGFGHLSSEMPLSAAPVAEPGPTLVVRGKTVSLRDLFAGPRELEARRSRPAH